MRDIVRRALSPLTKAFSDDDQATPHAATAQESKGER